MDKYICIHGHFYQPPRENPWLETVELQESAYPYHDWNARITAECYEPNASARILTGQGKIQDIVNNYSRISFDFGPTLLAWLETAAPDVLAAIVDADRASQERFSGHGSAIAQAYNHMILPLANLRDKYTQIVWGIRDFERRFHRKPEGMWLPETAVDLETLDLLAELGIHFTILSPYQADRVRRLGDEKAEWTQVEGGHIDPTTAYLQKLPSGRSISIFFYDGPISRDVAFGGLLDSGENLANRLVGAFNDDRTWPQIVHIATDGETYGHHHKYGDMALAYALDYVGSNHLATITNYGEYLDRFAPEYEVEIFENTSWSCAHGIGRWYRNCGCNSGGYPQWNQEWRTPLREALDWLRDEMAPRYEAEAAKLLRDPWQARNDYIDVILDRSPENRDRFFAEHALRPLTASETTRALKLLELQRHAMLMYTSCGWFFDDLSGIETVQVIAYAARALQLAGELFDENLESGFLDRLSKARSNIPENGDGRVVFEKFVRPAEVDLRRVAAHYAVSTFFSAYPDQSRIYSYTVERSDFHKLEAGPTGLVLSHARFTSEITGESDDFTFGVLHFGDQNLSGGVRQFRSQEAYAELVKDVTESFDRADIPEVLRCLDQHLHELAFSLESLFKDEQQRALQIITKPALEEAIAAYDAVYRDRAVLMRFMKANNHPIPGPLHAAAEFAVNARLEEAFASDPLDKEHVEQLLEEAKRLDLTLDTAGLGYRLGKIIKAQAEHWAAEPGNLQEMNKLRELASLAGEMPFSVRLWSPQNMYFGLLHTLYPEYEKKARAGDEQAAEWARSFLLLGQNLQIAVPEPPAVEQPGSLQEQAQSEPAPA